MVVITCDNCKRRKRASEEWILGFNLASSSIPIVKRAAVLDVAGLELLRAEEHVISKSARPSKRVLVVKRWDNRSILQERAVHLCSPECEREYTRKVSQESAA